MITGKYPFLGETLQGTYDKVRTASCFPSPFSVYLPHRLTKVSLAAVGQIANDPVEIPGNTSPQLADLMQRLLYKGAPCCGFFNQSYVVFMLGKMCLLC